MLSRVIIFRKRFTCPSSELLCEYHSGRVSPAQQLWIQRHLAGCDFCGAESCLLSQHPPHDEFCPTVDMPPHVRRLAEAILRPDRFAWEVWAEAAFFREPSLTDA